MNENTLQILNFLAAPFAMCLILVGIHCYLGLHVLARGVIFIDLSLAQVAALGSTLAFAIGYDHHGNGSYFISLVFTLIFSGLFAFARRFEKNIPQEAIIGIVYALCSASIILVVDRIAHGAEHIKDVLVGQILWVTWHDVIKTASIYAGVSLIHYIFRKKFMLASQLASTKTASNSPKEVVFWDFLFFALFGVIITSSVGVAGVLLVFSFLIVPATLARLFCKNIRSQLFFGWILGTCLSFLGLSLSHFLDLPAGALIVVCFTSVPVLILLLLPLLTRLNLRTK